MQVLARVFLAFLIAAAPVAEAAAQLPLILPIPGKKARPQQIGPPEGTPPWEAQVWPFPPPDPKSWWEDKRPKVEEAADPLGGRRVRRGERLPQPDNGVDPSTYRLWGLMPLQWQVMRGDDTILEVWTRPSNSVRQTVTRIVVREDGEAFVQARAGFACCEAGISRRLGFDEKLPAGSAQKLLALRQHPLWRAPREVTAAETGSTEAICVEGTSYDLTLLTRGQSKTVRRACDAAEIGEAADVLEAVIGAALGHDPRFDVVFRGSASYASARGAYQDLIDGGGRLKPDRVRAPPPGSEPAPLAEAESATESAAPAAAEPLRPAAPAPASPR